MQRKNKWTNKDYQEFISTFVIILFYLFAVLAGQFGMIIIAHAIDEGFKKLDIKRKKTK